MKNFKTAILAAASLSALSISAAVPALAQTAPSAAAVSSDSPTSAALQKSTVADFEAQYGVTLVQDTTPMVSRPVDSAPPTARLRDLQRLAVESGVTWRKVYRVTPATAGNPVTTLAAALHMVDQSAQVSLSSAVGGDISLPEATAFRTVATADNAIVKFTDGTPDANIDIDLIGSNVAQAIAALAQQTHTHWQAVYLITPIAGRADLSPSRVAYAARPRVTQEQSEETQYNNGPFIMHFAYPAATDATTSAAGAAIPGVAAASAATPGSPNAANAAAGQAQTADAGAGGANPNATTNPAGDNSPSGANPYGAAAGYSQYGGYNPYGSSPASMPAGNSVYSTPYSVYGGYGPAGYGDGYGSSGAFVDGGLVSL